MLIGSLPALNAHLDYKLQSRRIEKSDHLEHGSKISCLSVPLKARAPA
jgi:hypothetical protein